MADCRPPAHSDVKITVVGRPKPRYIRRPRNTRRSVTITKRRQYSTHSVTARQSSSGRQPNFAPLNRGRHPCSAGRPSSWALAHILVTFYLTVIRSHDRKDAINYYTTTTTTTTTTTIQTDTEARDQYSLHTQCCTRKSRNHVLNTMLRHAQTRHKGSSLQACTR